MSAPVLLVHPAGAEAEHVEGTLRAAGTRYVHVADGASALQALTPQVSLVLSSERLADTDGPIMAFRRWAAQFYDSDSFEASPEHLQHAVV